VEKLLLGLECLAQHAKLSAATLQQKQQPHFFEDKWFSGVAACKPSRHLQWLYL